MRYFFTLLPLLLLLSTRSCDNRVDAPETADGPVYKLGDTLTLVKGAPLLMAAEKLKLTYEKNADNRCPEGVNCIVAGKAKISLAVDRAPTLETVQLEVKGMCKDRIKGSCGNSAQSQGYRFKIYSADPYPGTAAAKAPDAAESIRLVVSKAE